MELGGFDEASNAFAGDMCALQADKTQVYHTE